MPNELPAFLQEFIKHRQTTRKSDPTPKELKHDALNPAHKAKDSSLDVKGIIEKKPTRKAVDKFLQKRCDELSAAKVK